MSNACCHVMLVNHCTVLTFPLPEKLMGAISVYCILMFHFAQFVLLYFMS